MTARPAHQSYAVTKSILHDHLHKLAETIGNRPGGSPGNHIAADYIESVFTACGLAIEVQPFACPDWHEIATHLWLAAEPLNAVANAYSPPCDVTAVTVAVGTLAELEFAYLTGRIVVLYGDLTRAPLSPKSWMLKDERQSRIIELLETKQPAAILTVQTRPGKLERLIEDWEFTIPSATVPTSVGLTLLQQVGSTAHLRIESESIAGSTANIVARLPGQRPEQIVFCAHYDSKIDTPGASDNATGVAVLLTLAQILSQTQPTYSLEFVAFTNEEYLPLGDDEYVRLRGETFDQIVAAINYDGLGRLLGVNSLMLMQGSAEFEAALRHLTHPYPDVLWVDPWPESNHSTFAWRGVPSLAFTSHGGDDRTHLRSDRLAWISSDRLVRVVQLSEEIVACLAEESLVTRSR